MAPFAKDYFDKFGFDQFGDWLYAKDSNKQNQYYQQQSHLSKKHIDDMKSLMIAAMETKTKSK